MKRIVLLFVCVQVVVAVIAHMNTQKTVEGCIIPPPINVKCIALSNSSILVTWDSVSSPPICGIKNFEVFVDDVYYNQAIFSTDTKQTLVGLEVNKTYLIKVRTISDFGSSNFSETVSFKISDYLVSKVVLSENFDKFIAGSPGPGVSTTEISSSINNYTQTTGWTGYRIYQAGGVAKMGASSTLGYITTPEINLSGNSGKFNVQFDAMAWNTDSKLLKIYLNDILTYTIPDLNNDTAYKLKKYNIELSGGTATSKIRFEGNQASKGRFFLDNLKIYQGIVNFPNLHVISISISDSVSGKQAIVKWTVRNDGKSSTSTSKWHDKVWLIKDIRQNFSNAALLLDKFNKDSLSSDSEYNDSAIVVLPERLSGEYYLVVTSDIKTISSIDWSPSGNIVPNPYTPNITNSPYPYLFANTGTYFNELYEDGEVNNRTDNFFYKAINMSLPPLADLHVVSVDLPTTLIAERKATIGATITNKGNVDVAAGKSFINRLYWTKDATFNKNTATLLASKTLSGGLIKDGSQSIQFAFTAPADSVNLIRFFAEADALDSIFELDQTNNVSSSNWLKLKANTIQSTDYAVLKNFYASAGGSAWTTKWNTASNVINSSNWYGVTFNEGYVTSITFPSNNITATFPLALGSLDSLVTLQLSFNKLSGEIPSLTNKFHSLRNLNLSDNQFSSMESALPASITNVNLGYQQFLVDSLHLSVNPTISLPQILTYNHAAKAFSTKPSFVIFDGYSQVGNLWYNASNEPEMSWNNANGWLYKSGKVFTINQNNGSTYGSNAALKIYYNYGDANVDKQISILDVQHTLNYMLGEPSIPFNFSAADTYCDTLITVQDIVSTINILLNEVVPEGPPESIIRKIKASDFSPATVYIADKKLMLNTTVPVAAIDVTISGLTEVQLQLQLAKYGFSVITRKLKDGSIRFVAFSVGGNEIPVGNTCIADVNSEKVEIKQVALSNKQAQRIAVEVWENINTHTGSNWTDVMTISSYKTNVKLLIPSGFEIVNLVVYNPQGVEIARRDLQAPMAGSYQFNFGTDIRMSGVYFIKVVAKSNKIASTINSKIIVSK